MGQFTKVGKIQCLCGGGRGGRGRGGRGRGGAVDRERVITTWTRHLIDVRIRDK